MAGFQQTLFAAVGHAWKLLLVDFVEKTCQQTSLSGEDYHHLPEMCQIAFKHKLY